MTLRGFKKRIPTLWATVYLQQVIQSKVRTCNRQSINDYKLSKCTIIICRQIAMWYVILSMLLLGALASSEYSGMSLRDRIALRNLLMNSNYYDFPLAPSQRDLENTATNAKVVIPPLTFIAGKILFMFLLFFLWIEQKKYHDFIDTDRFWFMISLKFTFLLSHLFYNMRFRSNSIYSPKSIKLL